MLDRSTPLQIISYDISRGRE